MSEHENSSVKSFPASSHRTTEKKRRVPKEDDEGYTSDLISRARSCARNDKFIILGLSETRRAANLYKCKSRSRNVLPFLSFQLRGSERA